MNSAVAYVTRDRWRPFAPPIPYITAPGTIPEPLHRAGIFLSDRLNSYRYTPLSNGVGFHDDAEAGLHSSNFSLADNIEAEDSRRGLDEGARQEVYRIMKVRRVTFDEARRMFTEERFGREGIAADGRPLDRKAVMFDR